MVGAGNGATSCDTQAVGKNGGGSAGFGSLNIFLTVCIHSLCVCVCVCACAYVHVCVYIKSVLHVHLYV